MWQMRVCKNGEEVALEEREDYIFGSSLENSVTYVKLLSAFIGNFFFCLPKGQVITLAVCV